MPQVTWEFYANKARTDFVKLTKNKIIRLTMQIAKNAKTQVTTTEYKTTIINDPEKWQLDEFRSTMEQLHPISFDTRQSLFSEHVLAQ